MSSLFELTPPTEAIALVVTDTVMGESLKTDSPFPKPELGSEPIKRDDRKSNTMIRSNSVSHDIDDLPPRVMNVQSARVGYQL
jgi:hypothetical protein